MVLIECVKNRIDFYITNALKQVQKSAVNTEESVACCELCNRSHIFYSSTRASIQSMQWNWG